MANLKRGEVEIDLQGEKKTLAFDWNTISEVEQVFGGKAIEQVILTGSHTALISCIRAGLKRYHGKKTDKQVGRMIGESLDEENTKDELFIAVYRGVMAADGKPQREIEQVVEAIRAEMSGEDGPTSDLPEGDDDVLDRPTSPATTTGS